MAEAAFVYALLDVDGRPRYVGHSKDVRARVAEHWKTRQRPPTRNRAFYAWLCSLGSRPEWRVIAQVRYADRYKQEHLHTERLRAAGADLLNINSGARLAAGHQARLFEGSQTPEALERRRVSRIGRKGTPASPERRARISAASKAHWQDPDYRAKVIAGMTGLKQSPETIAKRVATTRARRLAREAA